MGRLFGTDGIRGIANAEPLTTELAFRLGRQLVATLLEHHGLGKVRLVVGRDTRLSGPMLEGALVSGALSAGADVFVVGVLPTPGIAYLTRALEAHGGVVLSASHNAFQDNGIKIFSSEGSKFPDGWEAEIEARLAEGDVAPKPTGEHVGRLVRYDRAEAEYIAHVRRTFPFDLAGMTVAVDCAHGATHRVAPRLFRALGARVVVLSARPDGLNINRQAGALHPERLQVKVRAVGAHIGLAFDGDGDRLIAVDETGEMRDGDYILAICGRQLAAQARLKTGVVVTTVMANLGLDKALGQAGIRTIKTQVGDRYVLEEMVKTGDRHAGDPPAPVRAGSLHDQVSTSAGECARAREATARVDARARGCTGGFRARDGPDGPHPSPILRHGESGARHDRGRGEEPDRGHGRRPLQDHRRSRRSMSEVKGIGVDLAQIPRLRRIVERWDERFLRRVFTEAEIAYCRRRRDPIPHLAARFAAKEATLKALGTGLRMGVNWQELEVRRERGQAPVMVLTGRSQAIARARGGSRVLLSLTHDGDYAMAQALLVGDPSDAGAASA